MVEVEVEVGVDAIATSSSSRRVTNHQRVHEDAIVTGKPREQFEILEVIDEHNADNSVPAAAAAAAVTNDEERTEWPSGVKLWLSMASMMMCAFLRGLDLTVVSVAVPSITNEFKTIRDIGWYSAVNGIVISSTCFFFGKVYSVFDVKRSYLLSIVVYWLGSVVCTFAPTSKAFILGRALVSLGAAWQGGGVMTQLNTSFPLHKRSPVMATLMFTQTLAMVAAPVVGGALIRAFSWRACFGINIPLNFVALLFTAYGMQATTDSNPESRELSFWQKVQKLDLVGTLIVVPAITCLLIGLQWGGTKYGWSDARILVLLVASVVLLGAFGYLQYRLQDRAVLPPRILKNRSVLAGAWFNACCDGTLAVTEYYVSIYFQGVRGLSPLRSGTLFVPLIVGLSLSTIASGTGISLLGYYTPFMLFTSVVGPLASGLLTRTLDLGSGLGKTSGLLGLLGFAVGIGMQGPMMAISASPSLNPRHDISLASAVLMFGGGLGSALFVSSASVLFQNRLDHEIASISSNASGVNVTTITDAGLSDIRNVVGPERLRMVLAGYDRATVQTLYVPLALTVASLAGSVVMEWRSVKRKTS